MVFIPNITKNPIITYTNLSFLLTSASGQTKYQLQQGKLYVGTIKIYSLQRRFCYSRVGFHLFQCNSARLSDVFHHNGAFVIALFHCSSAKLQKFTDVCTVESHSMDTSLMWTPICNRQLRLSQWNGHIFSVKETHLLQTPVNTDSGHCCMFQQYYISSTLLYGHWLSEHYVHYTVSVTRYLTNENLTETEKNLSNFLSKDQSTWLSRKLKASVQSKVMDSIVVFQENCLKDRFSVRL